MSGTIQLFVTCLVDTFFPNAGGAVTRVLERAGMKVDFPPGQTCCGQPAFNAGMRPQAKQMAKHTIVTLETSPDPVVVPSGSCAAMIHHGYSELFAQDPAWLSRSRALADRTYEFSQFLVDVLQVPNLGARFTGRITYHPSCHLLRELRIDAQPKTLLAQVRGADYVELPEAYDCCGFGGVFSAEHPEISTAMLERKINAIERTGATTVVTCDAGCLMNIYGGLQHREKRQQVLHLAEILDVSSAATNDD